MIWYVWYEYKKKQYNRTQSCDNVWSTWCNKTNTIQYSLQSMKQIANTKTIQMQHNKKSTMHKWLIHCDTENKKIIIITRKYRLKLCDISNWQGINTWYIHKYKSNDRKQTQHGDNTGTQWKSKYIETKIYQQCDEWIHKVIDKNTLQHTRWNASIKYIYKYKQRCSPIMNYNEDMIR
jgi:hypothetical protein